MDDEVARLRREVAELRNELELVRRETKMHGPEIIMLMHVTEIMCAREFLRSKRPLIECSDVSEESLTDLETLYEDDRSERKGERFHVLLQEVLDREESHWRAVRWKIEEALKKECQGD
jgi:hypothetical protein